LAISYLQVELLTPPWVEYIEALENRLSMSYQLPILNRLLTTLNQSLLIFMDSAMIVMRRKIRILNTMRAY